MAEREVKRAALICRCADTRLSPAQAERIVQLASGAGDPVYQCASLCVEQERDLWARRLKAAGCRQLLVAGCPPHCSEVAREDLADKTGLARGAVVGLGLKVKDAARPREAARTVIRELEALALMPAFSRDRIDLKQTVLVVGGGAAGVQTAAALSGCGCETVLVERAQDLPGLEQADALGPAQLPKEQKALKALKDVRVLRGSDFRGLEGGVGDYEALIDGPQGRVRLECGAVVLATGRAAVKRGPQPRGVVSLAALGEAVGRLPRRREARSIALLLDAEVDETKASTEKALRIALELQDGTRTQVYLLCRDLRVAAPGLEALYDEAREAGVQVLKYDGRPGWEPAASGLAVSYRDALLDSPASLACDLLGLSEDGLYPAQPDPIALLTGVSADKLGRLQPNNSRLSCGRTNRLGIFAVGACRGSFYGPEIREEAEAAAREVHNLLRPGALEVELPGIEIDADKCALCLTCLRSCPHGALRIDTDRAVAAVWPGMCRSCGVCAGECPARAISLPAWTEEILLRRAES
jgi:heterodisulfide reductase subunit A-like polyferredoxin